ncbi:MAG: ribosomal protein S18-alanine N-acetyltransferase [Clostridia bacterium]|nr:ribosomal protein S18-alanine N-acetyltransferase [Clostridia bacterium]
MHITFVCTGNTCRSPMAEGIFKKIISEKNIDGVTCSSCGIYAFAGDCATSEAVKAAGDLGADISAHRSRAFTPYIIEETDLFVCMTESHAAAIKSVAPEARVIVLGGGIADPYAGNSEIYSACGAEIQYHLEILSDLIIMKIAPFSEPDVNGIALVENECFSAPWSEESIRAELNNENAHFLVAKAGDKVMGYIGVHEVAGEAYIANVAVSEKYRRFKIASALLAQAESGARERNCEFISLEVRKSNVPAISLYEKRGYTVKGERKNFYSNPTENGIIMTLDLG